MSGLRSWVYNINPFPTPGISTFVITASSSQNLCKGQSALFMDGERCPSDGTLTRVGVRHDAMGFARSPSGIWLQSAFEVS